MPVQEIDQGLRQIYGAFTECLRRANIHVGDSSSLNLASHGQGATGRVEIAELQASNLPAPQPCEGTDVNERLDLDDSRWCLRGLNRGAGGSWSSGSAGG